MKIELHIIQNFAPSNLNRDDTNSPKDCEFGGVHRARVSSQCLKRAIRKVVQSDPLVPQKDRAVRTKRLVAEVVSRLKKDGKMAAERAEKIATAAIKGIGFGLDGEKTEYLLFIGENEIDELVKVARKYEDELAAAADIATAPNGKKAPKDEKKDAKKGAKAALPKEVANELGAALDGGNAVDLALFGRMLAGVESRAVDAACQVAHAVSTHRVNTEFDFYTAIDDLAPQDMPGADMMGTVEFNSACYYRYANIDWQQLVKNLHGDTDLAVAAVKAFVKGSVLAIPSGKQNGTAAQNPPSFVGVVVRNDGLWSLANAFVDPIRGSAGASIVTASVAALNGYFKRLKSCYGEHDITLACGCSVEDVENSAFDKSESLGQLLGSIEAKIREKR